MHDDSVCAFVGLDLAKQVLNAVPTLRYSWNDASFGILF